MSTEFNVDNMNFYVLNIDIHTATKTRLFSLVAWNYKPFTKLSLANDYGLSYQL